MGANIVSPPKEIVSMDFEVYKEQFITKAQEKHKGNDYIDKCLSYAKTIIDNGCPVIYDSKHLALLLGLRLPYIMRAVTYTHKYYWEYKIPKKDGEIRTIMEPLPNLKEAQTWILHHILYNQKVHSFAKAYVPGKKLKENGKFHTKKKLVVALDVKDFFPSITKHDVKEVFRSFGYSDKLSDLLAKLCCLNDSLPQGAPTSPYLSNLYLREFDDKVMKYCSENKIIYTRYADDMTFSGDNFDISNLISVIRTSLSEYGLKLNNRKTKVMHDYDSQIVTGMVVNQKVRLPKKERMNLRLEMYYIIKNGIQEHLKHIGCTKRNYLRNLMGRVMYALYLEPENPDFKDYRDHLMKLLFPDFKRNPKRLRLESGKLVTEKLITELEPMLVEDFRLWMTSNKITFDNSFSASLHFKSYVREKYGDYHVDVIYGKMKSNNGKVEDCYWVYVSNEGKSAYYDVFFELTATKIDKSKSRFYFPLGKYEEN